MIKVLVKTLGLDKQEGKDLSRRYRILIVICGPLYAIWMKFFEHVFIPFFNTNNIPYDDVDVTPVLVRLIKTGTWAGPLCTVGILLAARLNKKVSANLYIAYQVFIYVLSAHFFLIVSEGHLHKLFVMATFVLVFSVSYMMVTARSAAAYMIFIVFCSVFLVKTSNPLTPKHFFVLGQITIGIFAFVTIADRRRLELEDKQRIAELTQSKRMLQESEELIRLSVDATGVATWQWNVKTDLVTGSAQYFKHLGLPEDQKTILNSKIMSDHIYAEDLALLKECFERVFRTKTGETIEYRMLTASKEVRWFESRGHVHTNDRGEITGLLGTTVDITEKKMSEFKERHSRESLELALEAGGMGTVDINLRTKVISWSDTKREMFAFTGDTVLETDFTKVLHPDDHNRIVDGFAKALECDVDWSDEYRIIHPKLGLRWISDVGRIFRDKNGKPARYIGISRDITEAKLREETTKKQQEMLFNSAQLSAIGEMASGIAHEIFTPVTAIKMRAQMIKRAVSKGKAPTDLEHMMGEITTDVDRCANIIAGLKLLSRTETAPTNIDKSSFKPIDIVKSTVSLCRQKMNMQGIALQIDDQLTPTEFAYGYPTMISQVVLNLFNNALDAMSEIDDVKNRWIKIEISSRSGFCNIAVTDSGNGIPKEVQDKMFLPFFTTKPVGKGTGLGLSISKGIMEKNGGNLSLDTDCQNTRFVATIPLAMPQQKSA